MTDYTKKGWINIAHYNEEFVRVSYTNPEYGEIRKDGVTYMSPATILAGYLSAELSMFGVEHSISTLRFMRKASIVTGSGIRDNLKPNKRGWMKGLTATDMRNCPVEIVLKYKCTTITNELGDSDYLPDFYMSILITHAGQIKLTGWRQELQYNHVVAKYVHSHLDEYDFVDPFHNNQFCTGSSETPVENAVITTGSFLREHAKDLTQHLYDRRRKPVENLAALVGELEFKANNLVAVLMPLLLTESTEGVPYCYIKYNNIAQSDYDIDEDDYSYLDDTRIKDFAKLVCNNIDDHRIKYRMTSSDIRIKDSPSLCEFAKEHGYYEDLMAIYKSGDYPGFNQPLNAVPNISLKQKVEIDIKLGMLYSPFTWKGKRLRCFATNINTTKINITDVRIHEEARYLFDREVTEFFEHRLMRRVLQKGITRVGPDGPTREGEVELSSTSESKDENPQPSITESHEISFAPS